MIHSGSVAQTAAKASDGQLVTVLELARRDSELFVHGLGVGRLAERIALALGIARPHANQIRLAGVLHDIGKLAVPRAILDKSGPLTVAERRIVERHSSIGALMVQLVGLRAEAHWIRHHHERMDGLGYPDRLAGRDIPLPSRIVLVAEAFDALISPHPYQAARTPDEAVAELRAHSGTQFDPLCVAAMEEVLADDEAGQRWADC